MTPAPSGSHDGDRWAPGGARYGPEHAQPSGVAARRAAGACRRTARRGLWQPGDLLPEGVHPVDHAVFGSLWLLHVRPTAGPAGASLPRSRRGADTRPRRGRGRLPRGTVHPRRAPGVALPGRSGLAGHQRVRVDGPLRGGRGQRGARGDGPVTPRQCRCALPGGTPGTPSGLPVSGHDDRESQRRAGGAPGVARQGADTPPGDAGVGR